MVHKTCSSPDVKEICSQIQLSRILPKNLSSTPKVAVYISSIFTGKREEDNNDENIGDEEDEDIESCKEKYKKVLILKNKEFILKSIRNIQIYI